jgi:putative ABC transport system permease protein
MKPRGHRRQHDDLQPGQRAAAGLGLGLAVSRLAASMLIGVSPTDPVAFLITPAMLGLVAAASIYLPARRATAVDPVLVLRGD